MVAMAEMTDEQALVERFSRGDEAAFEQIIELHSADIGVLANRLLCWSEDVEDVVQDVFLAALKGLKKFKGQCSLRTWLFTITINKCRTHRYKRMLSLKRLSAVPERDGSGQSQDAEKHALDIETLKHVRSAVKRLPGRYREPVVLRYLQELETDDISQILGISRNTLQVRLSRARKLLKENLAGIVDENDL